MADKLSANERDIMECYWEYGSLMSEDISKLLPDKKWKITTLLTFLSRLVSKGMLRVERKGKANIYHPIVSKSEYVKYESKQFIDRMFAGSTKNFIAALIEGNDLSKEDFTELRNWLSSQETTDD